MVSNFALCGVPFLAGFYSSDYILEIFSMRYVNIFGFLLLFVSTGLTVCYSSRNIFFQNTFIHRKLVNIHLYLRTAAGQ